MEDVSTIWMKMIGFSFPKGVETWLIVKHNLLLQGHSHTYDQTTQVAENDSTAVSV